MAIFLLIERFPIKRDLKNYSKVYVAHTLRYNKNYISKVNTIFSH